MYSIDRTIDATVEPVTVAQAKDQCRVVGDQEDDWFPLRIMAARQHCEKQTNRAFLQQTWRLSLDRFPRPARQQFADLAFWPLPQILLPRPNLIGIVSVTYLDMAGTRQTLDPSHYYADFDSEPARIFPAPGQRWPFALPQSGSVQITYTAGYGNTAAAVPATVQLAILGLVGHWYENREAVVLTNSTDAVTVVPKFVDDLLADEIVPVFTYED